MAMRNISSLYTLSCKSNSLKSINSAIRRATGISGEYFKSESDISNAIEAGDLLVYADKVELWWNNKPRY